MADVASALKMEEEAFQRMKRQSLKKPKSRTLVSQNISG